MDLRNQLQTTLGTAYTLDRELGGGGMSRVFVADETRLKRKVVVKVLSPELAQGISADRFEREIEMAASLQQANIVPVLSVGETNGLPSGRSEQRAEERIPPCDRVEATMGSANDFSLSARSTRSPAHHGRRRPVP